MKLDDKKEKRLEIRLSPEDYNLVKISAFTMGMTASRFVRMLIDTTTSNLKVRIKRGEVNLEDFKDILND